MIDFHHIVARMEDAAATLRLLPANNPHRRATTYWPDVIDSFWEAYGWNEVRMPRTPPDMKQIDRLEEVLEWLWYVPGDTEPEKHIYRKLALARAFGFSYARLGREILGCGKTRAQEEWMWVIICIAKRLNENAGNRANSIRRVL